MIKSNIQWNCKQVAKMFDSGSLTFDNAIQRGNVWDVKRQSLLIDSIIKGYPIPAFYTIKLEEKIKTHKGMVNVFDCIDGKQRCNAIRKFRANELVLTGLDTYINENGEEIDLNGIKYDDLDEDIRDAFDSYSLTVYFFTDISEDEISEMMSRLNNGKPLTGVENARIKAKNLDTIIRLANHPLFMENLTDRAINGYANEDIVIKTYMQNFDHEYELSTKCVKETYESADFNENVVNRLNEVFDITKDVIDVVRENTTKKIYKKVVSKTNFVTLIDFIACDTSLSVDIIAEFVMEFFGADVATTSEEYNESCKDGTNHIGKVMKRNAAIANAFREYANRGFCDEDIPF